METLVSGEKRSVSKLKDLSQSTVVKAAANPTAVQNIKSLRKVLECGRVSCRFSPSSISLDPTLFHSLTSSPRLTMRGQLRALFHRERGRTPKLILVLDVSP